MDATAPFAAAFDIVNVDSKTVTGFHSPVGRDTIGQILRLRCAPLRMTRYEIAASGIFLLGSTF